MFFKHIEVDIIRSDAGPPTHTLLCTELRLALCFHIRRSISPDAVHRKTRAVLTGGGETFFAHGVMVSSPGFTAIMPWRVR